MIFDSFVLSLSIGEINLEFSKMSGDGERTICRTILSYVIIIVLNIIFFVSCLFFGYAYSLEEIIDSEWKYIIFPFGVFLPIALLSTSIQYFGSKAYSEQQNIPKKNAWLYTISVMTIITIFLLPILQVSGIFFDQLYHKETVFGEFKPSIGYLFLGILYPIVFILVSSVAICAIATPFVIISWCCYLMFGTTTYIAYSDRTTGIPPRRVVKEGCCVPLVKKCKGGTSEYECSSSEV